LDNLNVSNPRKSHSDPDFQLHSDPDFLYGRLGGFSSDRLMRCLTALGQDVEIVVKTKARGTGRGRIRVVEKAA
jgi:hypothetical protein